MRIDYKENFKHPLPPARFAISIILISIVAGKSHKSPPPFNGAVKNKGSFTHGYVLAAGSSHSFNRSLGRSYLATPLTNSFVHLTSLSTPRVSVSYLNTHTFSHPQQHHSHIFLPANCLPHKTGSRSLSLCSAWLDRFIMLLK